MTSVGFTGTRKGMTLSQWQTVQDILVTLFDPQGTNEWHDGDCVGADSQAHASVAILQDTYDIILHGHPCNLTKYRAYNEYTVEHEVKAPLVRDKDIVNDSDVMVAAPEGYNEVFKGSGTWATIRYTRHKFPSKLYLAWPDGTVTEEENE